jgi:hypothetical protein
MIAAMPVNDQTTYPLRASLCPVTLALAQNEEAIV